MPLAQKRLEQCMLFETSGLFDLNRFSVVNVDIKFDMSPLLPAKMRPKRAAV